MSKRVLLLARGFTLVELLVVMSLMSLIMVAMTSVLRTMAQVEARLDEGVQRMDGFESSVALLRTTVGRMLAKPKLKSETFDVGRYIFNGTSASMEWVGIMPARFGVGGRYFFRLAPESRQSGNDLVLRFSPWMPGVDAPDWQSAHVVVLVEDVRDFRIQYERLVGGSSVWLSDWIIPESVQPVNALEQLPSHVRMLIQSRHSVWPEIIVPTRLESGGVGENIVGVGGHS